MNTREIILQNNGINETYTLNKYASLNDISIMQKVGGSMILCSICIDYDNPVKEDFLPLSVQYIERYYAIGKIPQGYAKREGKPSDSEVLISRLIDRSIRPLFKDEFNFNTQITFLVLSYDGVSDIARDCVNLASIALQLSSIPLNHRNFLVATRVVKLDVPKISTNINEILESKIDLFVSGFSNGVSMIEMQSLQTSNASCQDCANEVKKEEMINLIKLAHKDIKLRTKIYKEAFSPFIQDKKKLQSIKQNESLLQELNNIYSEQLESLIFEMGKSERLDLIKGLENKIKEEYEYRFLEIIKKEKFNKSLDNIVNEYAKTLIKSKIRQNSLNGKRVDKRKINEIRKISIDSNILPNVHGSALFTRGQTQALVSCTIGNQNDAQINESLQNTKKKKILFHYNFFPFSVNEAFPLLASSRREIGHGNLALKAISSNIKPTQNTLRLVSEILQSNGSSSMASICGASIALKGANVGMHNLVAGLALGLIYEGKDKFVILSDILGVEDFCGDMDLKIAGSKAGFSALQLDIKINALSLSVFEESLKIAEKGLDSILKIMERSKIKLNLDALPLSETFPLKGNKPSELIGKGGQIIREVTNKFDVKIDINKDSNEFTIVGSQENISRAKDFINNQVFKKINFPFKEGESINGVVKKIFDFGLVINLSHEKNLKDDYEGLLHKSKFEEGFIEGINIGDELKVRVSSMSNNKISLELDS